MTMIRLVQYSTHPDRTDENRALVQAVVAELEQRSPVGFRYTVLLSTVNHTFTHLVMSERADNPLVELPAFQEFQLGLRDRITAPSNNVEAELVGSYEHITGAGQVTR